MSQQSSANSGGIGGAGLLGVAFVVLKLMGVINWPWLWVLAPFWISALIVLAIFAIAVVIIVLSER